MHINKYNKFRSVWTVDWLINHMKISPFSGWVKTPVKDEYVLEKIKTKRKHILQGIKLKYEIKLEIFVAGKYF